MARENNKFVKMARAAKSPMEVKAVMEAIEEAMSVKKHKTMTTDMDEALGILLNMESKPFPLEQDIFPPEYFEDDAI